MKPDGHKKVAEEAGIWRLKKALESYGISGNTYPSGLDAFYLGNWLADHSQFRDDAHGIIPKRFGDVDKKSKLHASLLEVGQSIVSALESNMLTIGLDVADKLSIKKEEKEIWIANFFYDVSSSFNKIFEVYRDEIVNPLGSLFSTTSVNIFLQSLIRYKAYSKFVYNGPGKQPKIDPAVFFKIFDKHYTQYLPHEHLDRPVSSQTIPSHTKEKSIPDIEYADKEEDEKSIYKYMEDAIKVVAGQLHELDKEWAKPLLSDSPPIEQSNYEWHLRLSDLGRSLHLLEDFFAHSNFVEVAIMGKSSKEIKNLFYDKAILEKALRGIKITAHEQKKIENNEERVRKVYKRLLTYSLSSDALYKENLKLQDEVNIVTGYFDGPDALVAVFEAIIDFIKHFTKKDKENPDSFLDQLWQNIFEDMLKYEIKTLTSINEFFTDDKLKAETDLFKDYINAIRNNRTEEVKRTPFLAADLAIIIASLFDAMYKAAKLLLIFIYLAKLIMKRKEEFEKLEALAAVGEIPVAGIAVKWFTGKFGETFRKYLAKEMLQSGITFLDDNYDPLKAIFDWLGKNRIGSHSLLAKDLPQEPLYNEMFNCAKTVHFFVIDAMCRWSDEKWKNNKNNPEWIDWEDLIFHFLRHPKKMSATTQVVKREIYAMKPYLTKDKETFDSIFTALVKEKQEFSIDYLLQINNIPVSYLHGTSGGTPLDVLALRNYLITTNKAFPAGKDNYQLKPGLEINIPFITSVNVELPDKAVWYDSIMQLDSQGWSKFFEEFMKDRKNYYDNSQTANKLYTYKFLSDDECLNKINTYSKLKTELKEAYNKK
jgi:hypothetical protein